MKENPQSETVGEDLQSFVSETGRRKKTLFKYSVEKILICRNFFQFIHGCSYGLIKRRQDYIARGKPLLQKDLRIINLLRKFWKTQLNPRPNSEANGLRFVSYCCWK